MLYDRAVFMLFLFLLSGYLLGSFPTAYFVVKKFTGKDIRKEETGNVGAMNTARTTGKFHLFFLVFLVDALKGYLGVTIPTLFPQWGYDVPLAVAVGGFGVVLGHCYSLYFKIKDGKFAGGKAIASLFGILAGVSFWKLFAPWGIAMLALPFIGYFLFPEYFALTVLCAIPVFIKQWPRVIPMLQGKEPSWYFKGKKNLKN
jgi:glycerol-3-phosphate acyltransferase PlsY